MEVPNGDRGLLFLPRWRGGTRQMCVYLQTLLSYTNTQVSAAVVTTVPVDKVRSQELWVGQFLRKANQKNGGPGNLPRESFEFWKLCNVFL